jgi:hypothetical protein
MPSGIFGKQLSKPDDYARTFAPLTFKQKKY